MGLSASRLSQGHLRPVDDLNIDLTIEIVNHKNKKFCKKHAINGLFLY